jgi:N4-gp56 family major capsid protein
MAFPSNNNTDINSELFANLVVDAQYAVYENSVARQMVTVYDAPLNAGKVIQVPVWAGISAEYLTDEEVATAKTTNSTSQNITLAEHVVYHQVTDQLRDSAYGNVMTQLADQSGRAIAESMDTKVFAEFSNFTGANLGSTATTASVSLILQAAAVLRGNKLTGPFYAVVHPKQAFDIKKELASAGGTAIPSLSQVGENVLNNFYIGQVAGVQIYESSLVAAVTTGGATATYRAGVFAPSAIGHAMRGTIEMETQRQAARRATDVVLKAIAGQATINASHGVSIVAKSTI